MFITIPMSELGLILQQRKGKTAKAEWSIIIDSDSLDENIEQVAKLLEHLKDMKAVLRR